jgi:hypothetical protein
MVLFRKTENRKQLMKLIWENKRPQVDKAILSKNNKARDISILELKTYCKAIIIK